MGGNHSAVHFNNESEVFFIEEKVEPVVQGKLPEDDKGNHTEVVDYEEEEPLSEKVDESDVEGKLAEDDKGNHTEILFVEKKEELEPVVEGKLPADDVGNHTEMIAANTTIIFRLFRRR